MNADPPKKIIDFGVPLAAVFVGGGGGTVHCGGSGACRGLFLSKIKIKIAVAKHAAAFKLMQVLFISSSGRWCFSSLVFLVDADLSRLVRVAHILTPSLPPSCDVDNCRG